MCHRCPQEDGTCVEYFKFRNEESFEKYKTAKWMPKPFFAKFINSGTSTNGYTVISKAAYEKGKRNGCQRVNPPPVYAKTTIIFGKVIKGYKQWHYNTICPIAAQNMRACYRCPQKNGHCLEYFKFRNRASFLGYQKYKWLKKSYLQRFMDSGTRTTGYEEINQAEYEAGRKAASCSKVQPAPKKSKKPVYATTKLTFGTNIAGFSQWMYKNICPLAAQQMLMCHRCPQEDGTCVEYFKFRNEESFKKYKTAKWMPKPFMAKFVRSGTGTNGYTVISKAAYEKGKRNGCQRVNPPPVYAKTTIIFGKVIKGYKQWHYNTICATAALKRTGTVSNTSSSGTAPASWGIRSTNGSRRVTFRDSWTLARERRVMKRSTRRS